jgi:hypothetical protein
VVLLEVENHYFAVIKPNLMLTSIRQTHRLRKEFIKEQQKNGTKDSMPDDKFCRRPVNRAYDYCYKCQVSGDGKERLRKFHREMCSTKSVGRLVMPAPGVNVMDLPSPAMITPYHYMGLFDTEALIRTEKGNYSLLYTKLSNNILNSLKITQNKNLSDRSHDHHIYIYMCS